MSYSSKSNETVKKIIPLIADIKGAQNPNALIQTICLMAKDGRVADSILEIVSQNIKFLEPENIGRIDYAPLLKIKGDNGRTLLSIALDKIETNGRFSLYNTIEPFLVASDFLASSHAEKSYLTPALNLIPKSKNLKTILTRSNVKSSEAIYSDLVRVLLDSYFKTDIASFLENITLCGDHEISLETVAAFNSANYDEFCKSCSVSFIEEELDESLNKTAMVFYMLDTFGLEEVLRSVNTPTQLAVIVGVSKVEPFEIMKMKLPVNVMSMTLSFLS
jgi:hypothetical protein